MSQRLSIDLNWYLQFLLLTVIIIHDHLQTQTELHASLCAEITHSTQNQHANIYYKLINILTACSVAVSAPYT